MYANHEGDIYLALVHDVFGHWTLTKAKLKEIAKVKLEGLNCYDEAAAIKIIAGTCRSMGVDVID